MTSLLQLTECTLQRKRYLVLSGLKVFGVLDAPEYSGQATGVYRPVIDDGKDEQAFFGHSHGVTADVMSTSSHGHGEDQVCSQQVLQ